MISPLNQLTQKPFKSWPGTFNLHQNKDGSFYAGLSMELTRIEWALSMKLDIAENQLATAFLMIGAYSTNLPEQYANLVVRSFNDVLGNDINIMLSNDHPGEVRAKARNKITKLIVKALDGLEKKGERKSHGSAITLEMADGKKQLLAWVILEHARKLVEETQDLPTKGQIKQSVISAFPEVKDTSSAQWAKAFKEAGLAKLQRSNTW